LRPEKMSADDTHTLMETIAPRGTEGPYHLNLIAHGRRVCHARSPECGMCVLRKLCPYPAAQTAPAQPKPVGAKRKKP
jgi:endonuclease III